MKKRMHVLISGRVQGVCFRMYACDEATRLGLTGWVRNLREGSVEALAEGEEEALAGFLAWCRRGPPHARVAAAVEDYSAATAEFDEFTITA